MYIPGKKPRRNLFELAGRRRFPLRSVSDFPAHKGRPGLPWGQGRGGERVEFLDTLHKRQQPRTAIA